MKKPDLLLIPPVNGAAIPSGLKSSHYPWLLSLTPFSPLYLEKSCPWVRYMKQRWFRTRNRKLFPLQMSRWHSGKGRNPTSPRSLGQGNGSHSLLRVPADRRQCQSSKTGEKIIEWECPALELLLTEWKCPSSPHQHQRWTMHSSLSSLLSGLELKSVLNLNIY